MPDRDASRVAAGMPIAVAAAHHTAAAIQCHCGGSERPAAPHATTVNAEPQVPGPGRRCPVPSSVLTAHAQSRRERCAVLVESSVASAPAASLFILIVGLAWLRE